ncbi:hypothetical protein PTW32_01660 [Dechloromonas agitata]|uniref:hypothetical protein n=1 Tax=Dechloromonas agitata TaxID=73030 RepID=UPI00237DE64D|nr:hypothetical protein [Dechloromonas agitata]MDE1544108.1 hypothetical protein [Dechloromonas agitata]
MKTSRTTGPHALPDQNHVGLEALLGDQEAQMVIEALYGLRETKIEALHTIQAAGIHAGSRSFEPRDFGIPQIDRLLARCGAKAPVETTTMTMRSGVFPDARCDVPIIGFVVSVVLPKHPDQPDFDNLYPRLADGGYFAWMEQLPGVLSVMRCERDGGTVFDISVHADRCNKTPAAFAAYVRDTLNAAGFQW